MLDVQMQVTQIANSRKWRGLGFEILKSLDNNLKDGEKYGKELVADTVGEGRRSLSLEMLKSLEINLKGDEFVNNTEVKGMYGF
jgi:hypothetical protein